jgi:hypothetical protein
MARRRRLCQTGKPGPNDRTATAAGRSNNRGRSPVSSASSRAAPSRGHSPGSTLPPGGTSPRHGCLTSTIRSRAGSRPTPRRPTVPRRQPAQSATRPWPGRTPASRPRRQRRQHQADAAQTGYGSLRQATDRHRHHRAAAVGRDDGCRRGGRARHHATATQHSTTPITTPDRP